MAALRFNSKTSTILSNRISIREAHIHLMFFVVHMLNAVNRIRQAPILFEIEIQNFYCEIFFLSIKLAMNCEMANHMKI